MLIVNPILNVYTWFKYFLTSIPSPILYLMFLGIALYVISVIVHAIFR